MNKIIGGFLSIIMCASPINSGEITYKNKTNSFNTVNQQVIEEKIIEFGDQLQIIGIPVTELYPEFYFQNRYGALRNYGGYVQQQNNCYDNQNQDVKKLVVEVIQELVKLGVISGNGQVPVPNPSPSPTPSPTPNPEPPSTLETSVYNLLNSKCSTCHNGTAPKGGFSFVKDGKVNLIDKNGKLKPSEMAWLMFNATLEGRMPQSGNQLTNEEVNILQEYAKVLTQKERDK